MLTLWRLQFLLLVWTTVFVVRGFDAELEDGAVDDFLHRLSKRILEPPPTSEEFFRYTSPEGTLVLDEERGVHQSSHTDEDSGIQYEVLNTKNNGTYEIGYDTRNARKGARFFRHEEKGPDNRLRGQYGFVDAYGDLHVIAYVTDDLGHRIRTETHKIKGYGHELTRILEKGFSSADVKDHIDEILKHQSSSTSLPAFSDPETTTENLIRLTRSTSLPTGPEPYFDDQEPEPRPPTDDSGDETKSKTLAKIATMMGLMDKAAPTSSAKSLQQTNSFSNVNMFPSVFGTSNEEESSSEFITSQNRPPSSGAPSSLENKNTRYFILHTTPAPDTDDFPPPPNFPTTQTPSINQLGKQLSTSDSESSQTLSSNSFPWSINIPIPETESLSPEHNQNLRSLLLEVLRGNGKSLGDINMKDMKNLDRKVIITTLDSLLSGNGKNLDGDDIIHGEIVDGGIINGGDLGIISPSGNGNIIDGGIIDGGIISVQPSLSGKDFRSNSLGSSKSAIDLEETIIDGGVIDGGIIGIEDGGIIESAHNTQIDDGGIIEIDHSSQTDDMFNKDNMFNEAKLMNLMALEKLLESDNADTFIGLLNLNQIVRSNSVDRITKEMILNRMLVSNDEETVSKAIQLKDILDADQNSQRSNIKDGDFITSDLNNAKSFSEEQHLNDETIEEILNSDSDEMMKLMILSNMMQSKNADGKKNIMMLKEMMDSLNGKSSDSFTHQDSLNQQSIPEESVANQFTETTESIFPEIINHEPLPQAISISPQPQIETSQVNVNPVSSEEFEIQSNLQEANMEKLMAMDMGEDEISNIQSQSIETTGKSINQNNIQNPNDDLSHQSSSELRPTDAKHSSIATLQQFYPELANNPNIRFPEVIHYIPSPDLSTNKPNSQQQRPPLSIIAFGSQVPRPNVIIDLNSESNERNNQSNDSFDENDSNDKEDDDEDDDNDDDNNDNDARNLNFISPIDHNSNSESNLAIRPLRISSLSPHRSPVFINSTVIFTTTAVPRFGSLEDTIPRLSRPDLSGRRRKFGGARRFPGRRRLNINKSLSSAEMDAELESESQNSHEETHSSIRVRQDGNDINIKSGSLSAKSTNNEKATGTVTPVSNAKLLAGSPGIPRPSLIPNVTPPGAIFPIPPPGAILPFSPPGSVLPTSSPGGILPFPPPGNPVTPLPLPNPGPQVTFPPAPAFPVSPLPPPSPEIHVTLPPPPLYPEGPKPHLHPNVHVSSLPKPPTIIENRPPIHITTIVPSRYHSHRRTILPHLKTPLPHHIRSHGHGHGHGHSHSHSHAHSALPRHKISHPPHRIPQALKESKVSVVTVGPPDHSMPTPHPTHRPMHSQKLHAEETHPKALGKQISHADNLPSSPVIHKEPHRGLTRHNIHRGRPKDIPFLPIHTPTHSISSGPHHVFVQNRIHGPSPTPLAHHGSHEVGHLREERMLPEDVSPILHEGPPLIPVHNPTISPGRAHNQKFRNRRLQRRIRKRPNRRQSELKQ